MLMNNRGRNRPRNGNGFENPDYSPAVVLVNSKWDKTLQTKLENFRLSDDPELEFPPLESHLRKRIHEVARRFGLQSASVGKEPYRAVTVTRRKKFSILTSVKAGELRNLNLNPKIKQAITSFMETHPITDKVVQEYLSEESAARTRNRNSDFNRDYSLLVPPPSNALPEMMSQRYQLPAFKQRCEILNAIEQHQVVLVTGGTGCGKTTQVPQFLMEKACESGSKIRIICTQPRRLPAVAVAERVARERNEKCGLTVGYHIRLEQKTCSQTVLTYCTSGVLLRMLTDDEIARDVSHIILDEIHEREQNTDYLLIALKQAVKLRKDLKIILMSATMEGNLKLFKSYFGENINTKHVDIPSRLYHVEKFYLGDVLAMTGYIPENDFVSSFPFDSTFKESASFPNVSAWNSDVVSAMSNSASVSNLNFRFSKGFGPDVLNSSAKTDWDGEKWNSISSTPVNSFSQQYRTPSNQMSPNVYPGACSSQSYSHNALHNVAHQLAISQQNPTVQNTCYPVPENQQFSSQDPFTSLDASSFNQAMRFHPDQFNHPPPPLGQPIRHSLTWSGSANETSCYDNSMDIVDMPTSCIDPELIAEFEQMGTVSAQNDVGDEGHQNWTHTQSMSYMSPPENSAIHHWDKIAPYSNNKQNEAPQFYLSPDNMNSQVVESSVFGGGIMNSDNSFGAMVRHEQMEKNRMKHSIRAALADRYKEFNPQITEKLKSRHIDHRALVDNYKRLGGSEYEDSIDVNLVTHVVMHCVNSMVDGAILVFLPGYEDINQVREKLDAEPNTHKEKVILTLHSQMNSQDQQRVFEPLPSTSRKIILSTNIAEASLTIDDVVFVIDCGKVKEKSYDYTSRISQLKVSWIAKSNAEQRAGRAGRCRPGFCFRLYSFDNFDHMLTTQTAEMQRAAIHDVVLHARMFSPEQMSVKEFLQLAPEPPLPLAIEHSMAFLEVLGAMYSTSSTSDMNTSSGSTTGADPGLTAMGRLIAHLPLDPQLARLLLFGVALKCLSPIVTLVAALSHRDPFTIPGQDERERSNMAKDRFALRDLSDHMMLIRIMHEFDQKPPRDWGMFARSNYLSINVLKMIQGIRRQLLVELKRARLIYYEGDASKVLRDPRYNKYSQHWPMVQAAIVAGCYPGIGVVKNNNTKLRKIRISDDKMASLHPSSVIRRQALIASRLSSPDTEPLFQLLVFQEISRLDEDLALRTVSIVPPITALLFSGPIRMKQIKDEELDDVINSEPPEADDSDFNLSLYELDDNVVFKGNHSYIKLLLRLRLKLMVYFLDIMQNPRLLTTEREDHESLLATLDIVLSEEHRSENFKPTSNFSIPPDTDVHPTNFPQDFVSQKPTAHCELMPRSSKSDHSVQPWKSDSKDSGRRLNVVRETTLLEQLLPSIAPQAASYSEEPGVVTKQKIVHALKAEKKDKLSVRSEVFEKASPSQSCDVRSYQNRKGSISSSCRQSDNSSGSGNHGRNMADNKNWGHDFGMRRRQESQKYDDEKDVVYDDSFNGRQRTNSYRSGRNFASNCDDKRGGNRMEHDKPSRPAAKNWQQGEGKNRKSSVKDIVYEEYEDDRYYGDSRDQRSSATFRKQDNRYDDMDYNDRQQFQRTRGSFSNRDQGQKFSERPKNYQRARGNASVVPSMTNHDDNSYACDDVRLEQKDRKTWQQKDLENDEQNYRHNQGGSYDFEDVPEDPKVDRSSDCRERRRGGGYKSESMRNSDRAYRGSFKTRGSSDNQFRSTSSRDDATSQEERPRQSREDFNGRGSGRKKVFYNSRQNRQGTH